MGLDVVGRLPTVPEYYKAFIDRKVDLTEAPKQCCPFHKENTPSFSYDVRTGRWSCFGSCHAHGGVIEMHRRWFRLPSDKAAEDDLKRMCRMRTSVTQIQEKEITVINHRQVDLKVAYMQANLLANTPERWVELDEVMSKYPTSEEELYELYIKWSK